MNRIGRNLTVFATALGLASVPAGFAGAADDTPQTGQTQQSGQQATQAGAAQSGEATSAARSADVDLSNWDPGTLANGWRASALMDADVYGTGGEQIGEVHNLIVNADGQINSIIVEAGTFLDIGDNHFRVSWNDLQVAPDLDRVNVPVSEANVDQFSLFEGEQLSRPVGTDEYRFTELVGTTASLQDGIGYGMVDDLVFSPEGELNAIVAQPRVGTGWYAFPYRRGMYDRQAGAWNFPFSQEGVTVLQPYQVDQAAGG